MSDSTATRIAPCEVYISDHFQVVGSDLIALLRSEGTDVYPNPLANASYARAGHIKYPGFCAGSLRPPQELNIDSLRRAFDVTEYVNKNPSGRYFVAIEAPFLTGVEASIEKMSADGSALSGEIIRWQHVGFDDVESLFKPKKGRRSYAYIEISVPVPSSDASSM